MSVTEILHNSWGLGPIFGDIILTCWPRQIPGSLVRSRSQWVSRGELWEREGICVHTLRGRVCWHECRCVLLLVIHVWFDTAGHQQLWQASAVERDKCCHSQVTPKWSPLISVLPLPPPTTHTHTHTHPSSLSALPSQSQIEVDLLLGLIGHEKKKQKRNCAMTCDYLLLQEIRGACIHVYIP